MKLYLFLLPLFVLSMNTRCSQASPQEDASSEEKDIREEVLRVFMSKRLEKAADLLAQIHKKGIFPKLCLRATSQPCPVFNEEATFSYEEIHLCAQAIERDKSLKPFIKLWSSMQARMPDISLVYLKDVAVLILQIYKTIYTACAPTMPTVEPAIKNSTAQAIAVLFSNIASLQAFELLNIIEKLTIQIPKLLEKYEITTGTLTWKEWITKYWWLPPMATAAIILEGIFIYQVAIGAKKVPAASFK